MAIGQTGFVHQPRIMYGIRMKLVKEQDLTSFKKVYDREPNGSQSRLIKVFESFSRLFNGFIMILSLSKG